MDVVGKPLSEEDESTFDKLPEAVRRAITDVSGKVAKLRKVLWAELKRSRPTLKNPVEATPAGKRTKKSGPG